MSGAAPPIRVAAACYRLAMKNLRARTGAPWAFKLSEDEKCAIEALHERAVEAGHKCAPTPQTWLRDLAMAAALTFEDRAMVAARAEEDWRDLRTFEKLGTDADPAALEGARAGASKKLQRVIAVIWQEARLQHSLEVGGKVETDKVVGDILKTERAAGRGRKSQ